ncbi:MAG: TRAP transporter small permease [Pseudomonadota bacterium]
MSPIIRFFNFIDKAFAYFIEGLLVTSLLFLAGITFLQVILRNFFDSGLFWADVGSRNLVMWVAFLGAMLATRERRHIAIEALIKVIPKKMRDAVRVLLDLVAALITAILAKAGYDFVYSEYQMGAVMFYNIKSWYVQSIIPFGFAMISLEYLIGVILDIRRLIMAGETSERTRRSEL